METIPFHQFENLVDDAALALGDARRDEEHAGTAIREVVLSTLKDHGFPGVEGKHLECFVKAAIVKCRYNEDVLTWNDAQVEISEVFDDLEALENLQQ